MQSRSGVFGGRRAALLGAVLTAVACSSEHPATGAKDGSIGRAVDAATDAAADARRPRTPDASVQVTPASEGEPYETLSEWHLFANAARQAPAEGVVPYEVIAQLFADYASKRRFVFVPKGGKIAYSATDKWGFPVGTILVKTFSYLADAREPAMGERLLETRLLIHESGGWVPHTYVWNAEQSEASLDVAGDVIESMFVDASGKAVTNTYTVPSENDCRTCHGKLGYTNTLGGRTLELDRDNDYGEGPENQIDHLAKLGLFDVVPPPPAARAHLVDPFGAAPVFDRVRSYFDGNCSQCHQPGNSAGSLSGLWLDYASTDPATRPKVNWGFCKQPASAGGATCGRQFDVVPGKPDDSIMICRMESELAKVKMPPVGRNLVHTEAVALLREWIAGLPGACGAPAPADAGATAREAGADARAPSPDATLRDANPGDAVGPGAD